MSNKLYDWLNKIQRWLPALATFWLLCANTWGVPYGDQVNTTIIGIATLLAATLEVANATYTAPEVEDDVKDV